jgi:hypothetical protein
VELSTDQIRALENGAAVPVTINHTRCVLLRTDIYERVQALLDSEDVYPLLDETFRKGWDVPGMADYDRYEELKRQCR